MRPSKIQTLRQEHDVRAAPGGLADSLLGAREIPGRLAGLDEHLCQDQFHGKAPIVPARASSYRRIESRRRCDSLWPSVFQ
jgi:hypothetical protein